MQHSRKVLGLGVLMAVSAPVFANESTELINDKSGMPQCIVPASGKGSFVRFIWNKDSFEREVFYEYHEAKDKRSVLCDSDRRIYLKDRFPKIDTKKLKWIKDGTKRILDPNTGILTFVNKEDKKTLLSVKITAEMKRRFAQVRLGGNVLLPAGQDSATKYMKLSPLKNYTLELNKELTGKYGAGFASDLYMEWLHSSKRNLSLKNAILDGIYGKSSLKNNPDIREKTSKYTVAFVKGFGHSLGGNDRYQPFIDGVRAHGMKVQVIYTEPYGRTPDNTFAVKTQLDELLSTGHNLIVSCGSNGCLQLIAAMAQLQDKLEVHTPEGYGKIAAMLSLSGVYYGAFAADWATQFPKWIMVRNSLHGGLKKEGIVIQKSKLDSFKDLRVDFVTPYLAPFIPSFPQKTKYFNIMGIPMHNGLVKDPAIGLLQSKTIRPYINEKFGANDGYIEFPGTEFRPDWAPEVYSTALNSSHAVMDGEFEGTSMKNGVARQNMISSMLDFVLSKVD